MNWEEYVINARPFDGVFIFDVHGHIGNYHYSQVVDSDAASVVHTLDKLGVDGICVSNMMQLSSDWKLGNDMTRAATEKYPNRIYGYVSPNPFYEDCDLRPYFAQKSGIRGIKIHGCLDREMPLDDVRYERTYELSNELHLPVLYHAWETWEVKCAINVAKRYPDAVFILGHSGFREYDTKLAAIEGCRQCENIYLDTAVSGIYDGAFEWIVSKVGVDRVVYGSDLAFFDCCHTLGQLVTCKLSDDDKEKILGLNARALFRL